MVVALYQPITAQFGENAMSTGISNRLENFILPIGEVSHTSFTEKDYSDEQKIWRIKDDLLALLEKGQKKFVFDFGKVEFLDASAIGMLVTFQNKVNEEGAKLAIFGISKKLHANFKEKRLDSHFTIVEDEPSALFEMTRENKKTLSIHDRRKLACAKHLGISPEKISKVEIDQDTSAHIMGLKVTINIHTGQSIDGWVQEYLQK